MLWDVPSLDYTRRMSVALLLFSGALALLWGNELRFDVASAAASTTHSTSLNELSDGDSFSWTGRLAGDSRIETDYVGTIDGYLGVQRRVEVYAWEHRAKRHSFDTWSLGWQRRAQDNERNQAANLDTTFESAMLTPRLYQLDELRIDADKIHLPEQRVELNTAQLTWRERSRRPYAVDSQYFYHGRGSGGPSLGDVRISYSAVPIPAALTYFGRFQFGDAVALESGGAVGNFAFLVHDDGVLHHLVEGQRDVALATLSAQQGELMWLLRLSGTLMIVIGVFAIFDTLAGPLMYVPVLRVTLEWGALLGAVVIGVPLALLTMVSGYLLAHPLQLMAVLLLVAVAVFALKRRSARGQALAKAYVDRTYTDQLGAYSIKEIEFMELAKLSAVDGELQVPERKLLFAWGEKQGWPLQRCEQLMDAAKRELPASGGDESANRYQVKNLIRLAFADGHLSGAELKIIKAASVRAGLNETELRALMTDVRRHPSDSLS